MSKLSVFEKWEIVESENIKEGAGELFNPEYATRHYNVDFSKLRFKKHYDVFIGAIIRADGVVPNLEMRFTVKGIKKLLKTNQKMIDTVNKEYEELQEFDRKYPEHRESLLSSLLDDLNINLNHQVELTLNAISESAISTMKESIDTSVLAMQRELDNG